jgi:hypothetical protein
MYESLLWLHSWWRWLVLIAGVVALVQAWTGWLGAQPWTPRARMFGLAFIIALDVQLLTGLLLYVVESPFTRAAFMDFRATMRNPHLRFWAVEHGPPLLLAVVLAHVGQARAKRAPTDKLKYRRFAVWGTVALVIILAAIPWPGLDIGRPLFR